MSMPSVADAAGAPVNITQDRLMPSSEYLKRLARLNVNSTLDLMNFGIVAQILPSDPVPLFKHADVEFALSSDLASLRSAGDMSESDSGSDSGACETIQSYTPRSIDIGKNASRNPPGIKFGIGLGGLCHWVGKPTDEDRRLQYSGFYVVLNAVDHSIWITIDFYPVTETGARLTLDPAQKDLGRIPGDDNLRVGTMRISQPEWEKSVPLNITGDKDPLVANEAYGVRLEQHKASKNNFQNAMKSPVKR